MLTIKNLTAVIDAKNLLTNVSLKVNLGEIHAILGPKGSGKSALAHVISGHPNISQIDGQLKYNRKDISKLSPSLRNKIGIFTAFQVCPEILGLTNFDFAKLVLKEKGDTRSQKVLEEDYNSLVEILELQPFHGSIEMNYEEMSPTEFRKNEILLMLLLDPKLAIIDEIDTDMSEKDITIIGSIIKNFINKKNAVILITHNKDLLDIVTPTHAHVIVDGEIKNLENVELYKRIIEDDYAQLS